MNASLADKVAIVTGATSGIGLATAALFVEQGAHVVIADIDADAGLRVAGTLGSNARFVRTDVTKVDELEEVVRVAVDTYGHLDVMVNNAGSAGDQSSMLDLGSEGFDATLSLLTRSVVFGHTFAGRQFKAQGTGGSAITTASAAGVQAGWSTPSYTIAKHAVVGAVRAAAVELGKYGVRCNAIAPGIIVTPIMARAFGVPLDQSEEFIEVLAERTATVQPIGRAGRPSDVANAALFLASDQSSFINGAVLAVDGGATIAAGGGFAAKASAAAQEYLESHSGTDSPI